MAQLAPEQEFGLVPSVDVCGELRSEEGTPRPGGVLLPGLGLQHRHPLLTASHLAEDMGSAEFDPRILGEAILEAVQGLDARGQVLVVGSQRVMGL